MTSEAGPYRTDYFAHNAEYVRRRQAGLPGWDDRASLSQTLRRMDAFLGEYSTPGALLELGCGAGDIALHWAARGWRVYGVDIAPAAIEWANAKAAELSLQADFFVGDVTGALVLPIPPVDLVIDGHCLHCLIGDDRVRFFANARQALQPGGVLHVNTMCGDPHHVFNTGHAFYDPDTRCVVTRDDVAIRYFGRPQDIVEEVKAAGFTVVRSEVIVAEDDNDEDCLFVNATMAQDRTC